MDRKRVYEEVIEILAHKLHQLPPPPLAGQPDDEPFDYENCKLVPDITSNHLDIAEVSMDLEDAFGVAFEEGKMPGSEDLPTIGSVVNYLHEKTNRPRAPVA
jgi:hypothetical protein